MTLAEIRPLLVTALVVLGTLSLVRSYHERGGQEPTRIPVQFVSEQKPQQVKVRRLVD